MNNAQRTIRALSHYRHDFLNDIQLIKSYIALDKIDKAESVIQKITYRAEQESRISRLQMPLFAEKLLTYNWSSPKVPVKVEVKMEEGRWQSVESAAVSVFDQVAAWAEAEAELGQESWLYVSVQEETAKELILKYTTEQITVSMRKSAELLIDHLPGVFESEITTSSVYICVRLYEEQYGEE